MAGRTYNKTIYHPPTKISEIKEPFYLNLTATLRKIQMGKKNDLHEQAWCNDMFEKCYDSEFQSNAVQLVMEDQAKEEYKYFAKMSGGIPVDPAVATELTLVMQVADAHDAIHQQQSPETDANHPPVSEKSKLLNCMERCSMEL